MQSGAIRHPEWNDRRIDFQPYPFPSYTEELVRRLQQTQVEGKHDFLASLDPKRAASELVDDRFVRKALASQNAFAAFGLNQDLSGTEQITP